MSKLAELGYDLTEGGGANGQAVVATPKDAAALRAKGYTVTAPYGEAKARRPRRRTRSAIPTHGYDVFRPWHLKPAACPGTCSGALDSAGKPINLQTWYENQRAAHPDLVKKVVYGKSRFGQDLVAYKVSAEREHARRRRQARRLVRDHAARARVDRDRGRPAPVRLRARHATDTATDIPTLLKNTEMWFVPVVNPDGYDYTFQSKNTRLWRKNLRDNDGDDVLTGKDGVDTNRNWAVKWRYDQEGAADVFSDDTYRGPSAQSEPEVSHARRADRQAQAEVPARLPLLRAADPLPGGLAGRDATARTRRRRRRSPASTTTTRRSRLRPGRLGRALHDQRRRHRPRLPALRLAGLHGRARAGHRPGRRRHRRRPELVLARRLRLPGLRGRGRGPVRAQPAVRARPRALGQEPGPPGLAPRQHRAGLRAGRVQVRLRRPAAGRGQREPRSRPGRGRLARQRRRRAAPRRRPSTRAASATTRPASTTTSCGPTSPASPRATRSRCGSRPAPRSRRRSPSRPRSPSPARCS